MTSHSNLRLLINPDDKRTFGPCKCCGNMTQRVWGYVNQDDAAVAAYFVEWTPGHADHAATFDLILGKWGTETQPADRKAVALAFRYVETGPEFMVVDAADRPIGSSSLVGEALSREQVIGRSIAMTAFAVCDSIFEHDDRISELRNPAGRRL